MAIKKSELYSSLWKSCDELRGGMDASQYKDYVLVLLFVKYVSDKYSGQKDALLVVPEGGSFADMVAAKGDKEIGDKMNKIIAKLAEANNLGVITEADFNNEDKLGKGKEMVDRLSNLVGIFENPALDFRSNRAEGDDILGDAYEYLMRHFATESGKSKGQFYTPAEVSIIMSRVIGIGSATRADQSIHDLTCGSGSLLIKAHDEAKSRTGLDLAIYGQEMDNATAALARMNMILHGCPTAEIWKDNVLSAPHFKERDDRLKLFDFIVANPPFSFKAWSTGFNPAHDEYGRFEFGVPPAKNGDYAFLLHVLTSLKSTGKAAVNLPHGVLFRGGAEADIRRNIVRRGYIKGIIERGRGMGLKPGYKQTEVGVIPAEWEVKPLGDVVDFLDGKRRPVKDSDRAKMRGDIPYYGASGVVDYVNDFLFDEDLILLGEHGENIISRNCRLAFKVSGKTWVNNHAHVLRPRQGMSLDYLAEFLEGLDYAEHNTGTAQPKLNKLVCSQIPVLRPPLPEQRTIAAALSDVDALISAQDKLIAKKRDLKQAAMQQLLTGKQRLPGFRGAWEVKRLGETFQVLGTANNPRADLSEFGNVGYVHYGDIHTHSSVFLNCELTTLPLISRERVAGIPSVQDGDLVMADASEDYEGIGKCGEVQNIQGRNIVAGLHTFLLRGDKSLLADGYKGYLQFIPTVKSALIRMATGISVYGVSKSNVRNIEVSLPRPDEQRAIAAVLSDMDAEIAALEQKRDKTRLLKQGMMQELLTGKTRLVA